MERGRVEFAARLLSDFTPSLVVIGFAILGGAACAVAAQVSTVGDQCN
jgi:hypothetical protein